MSAMMRKVADMAGDNHGDKTQEEPQAQEDLGQQQVSGADWEKAVAERDEKIAALEAQGLAVDMALLDGNPLHFDSRERNVVKGDAKCASIAAASIVAKVERDGLMCKMDERYPGYGFAGHKGYASAEHIAAIKEKGLSPIHRATFCRGFLQESLF